ncbi:MAG: hypothetical protein KJ042_09435 [Deltaproteobacteria bacterium]|nr:hypothetical protein [Deltaproteobacteria bacterium]
MTRSTFRAVWFFAALAAFAACSCGGGDAESPAPTPEEIAPTPPEKVFAVEPGDTVTVKLHVFTSRGLQLRDRNPLSVIVPAGLPFTFSQNRYDVPDRDYAFPLPIKFEVPRDMKPGEHDVSLPIKLFYTARDSATERSRNELVKIRVTVVEPLTAAAQSRDYPVEYLLE